MKRRTVLKYLCVMMGSIWTAVIAAPTIQFVIAPLFRRRKSDGGAIVRRVTLVDQLKAGVPQEFTIMGSRQDAWTRYPNELIGRVILVRRSDETGVASQATVDAYNSICTHLGCFVQTKQEIKRFVCPCHDAAFNFDGTPLTKSELGRDNAAPRRLDSLECKVVQDETTEEWWVEVTYQEFETGSTRKIVKT